MKLSDGLVLDARVTGEATERSIAGQIEFWAGLGRAVERVLRTDTLLSLKKAGDLQPLSASLESVDSEAGRERLALHLAGRPYPHFEPSEGGGGLIVKVDEDGSRTLGRFVNRQFRPAERR